MPLVIGPVLAGLRALRGRHKRLPLRILLGLRRHRWPSCLIWLRLSRLVWLGPGWNRLTLWLLWVLRCHNFLLLVKYDLMETIVPALPEGR